MKQAVKKSHRKKPLSVQVSRGVREAILFVLVAIALFLFIALVSYHAGDPGWSHTGDTTTIQNTGGVAGAWIADILFYIFGYMAYFAPATVAYTGWALYRNEDKREVLDLRLLLLRASGFILTLVTGCALAELHFHGTNLPLGAGGIVGGSLGNWLVNIFSLPSATLFLLALFFSGITLFTGLSWISLSRRVGKYTLFVVDWVFAQIKRLSGGIKLPKTALPFGQSFQIPKNILDTVKRTSEKPAASKERIEPVVEADNPPPPQAQPQAESQEVPATDTAPKMEPVKTSKSIPKKQMSLFKVSGKGKGGLPDINLLNPPQATKYAYSREALETLSRQVELKLKDFNVEAQVESVHPGPVVTRFELLLAPGTKVSKVTGLAKDLARALSVISVRVVEVIPGKPTIGLEIPNTQRETVSLREILASRAYQKSTAPLTLGMGKDIGGNPVIANIAKMPHLLVAGTTGSGKSVAVNAMLLSILYKAKPHEVRLILIDPKMLELNVYEGIPHLLTPVITDMKDAANGLRWSVAEMERRYRLMSKLGVRNMAGYNRKVVDAIEKGEPLLDPLWQPTGVIEDETAPDLEPMPYIVIVVDEFADMMMVVGKKVEELIARLAQKARAAGIHLLLATQRPSVDVITGLIKANIPSRVAFQVSSKVDSRTILDQMGAEQLLGYGDMLMLPAGTSIPERVHGAFVEDQEVHNVCDFLRKQGKPNYIEEIVQDPEAGDSAIPGLEPLEADEEADPLYDQAVAIVTESRKASISYVQRRLKIGYNRSARMIEQMESAGVVSAVQGSGGREVLAPPPPES